MAEETGVQVRVGELLHTVEFDYPAFHLRMYCYTCRIERGALQLREHTATRWLDATTLRSVDWLPADVELLPCVAELLE